MHACPLQPAFRQRRNCGSLWSRTVALFTLMEPSFQPKISKCGIHLGFHQLEGMTNQTGPFIRSVQLQPIISLRPSQHAGQELKILPHSALPHWLHRSTSVSAASPPALRYSDSTAKSTVKFWLSLPHLSGNHGADVSNALRRLPRLIPSSGGIYLSLRSLLVAVKAP